MAQAKRQARPVSDLPDEETSRAIGQAGAAPAAGLVLVRQDPALVKAELETFASLADVRRRDPEACLKRALDELELGQRLNPGRVVDGKLEDSHASTQYYVIDFVKGEKPVTGLSIGAARVLGRLWKNLIVSTRVVAETDDFFECEGMAMDMESVYVVRRPRRESKWYRSRKTQQMARHREDRFPQILAVCASKAERNAILEVIPAPIQALYWDRCKQLVAGAGRGGKKPDLKVVVPALLAWFMENYGVTRVHIEKKLGHPVDAMTVEEYAEVRGIARALKDGETTVRQAFGVGPGEGTAEEEPAEADPTAGDVTEE